MSQVASTNHANFDSEVLKSNLPVLVDFYAEWCGPCKMMAPVVDKIAGEMSGKMKVLKLDTDHSPQIAQQYGIMGVPTLIIFKDGQPVGKNVGYMNEQALTSFVKQHVG
ncbi:MAG: thioredoxin [Armatimonadetes bacterium]|nr:thioredoxin [Armatimonadota bacterium]